MQKKIIYINQKNTLSLGFNVCMTLLAASRAMTILFLDCTPLGSFIEELESNTITTSLSDGEAAAAYEDLKIRIK